MAQLKDSWRELTRSWAKDSDLKCRQREANLVVDLDCAGHSVTLEFSCGPEWLVMTCSDDKFLGAEEVPIALVACNYWNSENVLPTLCVANAASESGEAYVTGDFRIDSTLAVPSVRFRHAADVFLKKVTTAFEWLYRDFEF